MSHLALLGSEFSAMSFITKYAPIWQPIILSLNGEIDKRGHVDFEQQDQRNPDFVFHVPGTHEGNTLIVQVKGTLERRNEIIEDFTTVLRFINWYRYRAGVFIIYNHSFDELVTALRDRLKLLASDVHANSVYILAISKPCASCDEVVLSASRG